MAKTKGQFSGGITLCLAAMLALLLLGCRKAPEEWLQQAVAAEKAAQTAALQSDAKAAKRAADAASRAENRLRKLAEAESPGREERQRLFRQAQVAARRARAHADLAWQSRKRHAKLSGLKARAYRNGRTLILTTLLPQIAAATERAGQVGTNELTILEAPLARLGWSLATLLGDRSARTDGPPDWAGAASDLRQWSTSQTMELNAFLALTFFMLGQKDLALAELESVNPAALRGTNDLAIYHGSRALLYATYGWNQLAAPEAEAFSQQVQLSGGPIEGRQLVALWHGFNACEAFMKRDFVRMDEAVAESIRAWPDNPVAAFLTGERLAANGEWEKAADSLEARAAGTEDEWIARRLAQRARDLRDGRGTTKALVLDARFLVELSAHATAKTARNSATGRKLGEWVEEAKVFGAQLRQRIPILAGSGPGTNPTNQ